MFLLAKDAEKILSFFFMLILFFNTFAWIFRNYLKTAGIPTKIIIIWLILNIYNFVKFII